MPGLVPGIHALIVRQTQDVDGRDKPGHDDVDGSSQEAAAILLPEPAKSQRRYAQGAAPRRAAAVTTT
jgi:hypothetical protein